MGRPNWSELKSVVGDASHVPAALLALCSEDPGTRKKAYWELDNGVVVQGDLFDAAPYVAEAVVLLLREQPTDGVRFLMYRLLYEIGNGHALPGAEVELADGGRVSATDAARAVVGRAVPLIAPDVLSPDPALRREAIDLLVSQEAVRAEVLALLSAAVERTDDVDVRADLQRGLDDLAEDGRVHADELDYDENLVFTLGGRPFTGVAHDEEPAGASELRFRDGLRDGVSRDWYPSGALRSETTYRENTAHGPSRTFDESGLVVEETVHDHGVLVQRRARNGSGELVVVFELTPDHGNWSLLEHFRRTYGWGSPSA